MALVAETSGFFFPDDPPMGLVTVEALKVRFFHVKSMLPDLAFIAMASAEAVATFHFQSAMWLVAFKACQRGHRKIFGQWFVTLKTSFRSDHFGTAFGITMTIETVQPFHSHPMNEFILVALQAGILTHSESMKFTAMAFIATDSLHKDMPGMSI
jgi:hypothetical protein